MFDVQTETGDRSRRASTYELVRILCCEVDLPIVAAGGIMNGEHIKKIREAGADAVQMGTAFLALDESGSRDQYRAAIANFKDRPTQLTTAFSGRPARGIENLFMGEIDPAGVLPFPVQNSLTAGVRKEAQTLRDYELLSLWAGTNFSEARFSSVAELVDALDTESGGSL